MKLKNVIMATALITLPNLVLIKPINAQTMTQKVSTAVESRWCKDASYILRNSLKAAYEAPTFAKELEILSSAINRTLEIVNPKYSYYFDSTLSLSKSLSILLENEKDKVFLTRRFIQYAISDLEYLDSYFASYTHQNHLNYAVKVLNRGLNEGMRSKTDEIEMSLLNAVASSGARILSESDFRRLSTYACAVVYLKEVANNQNLTIKRDLILQAHRTLKYGCN